MRIDFSSLRSALISLEQALQITESDAFFDLNEDWRRTLIAGVIQNFEFCFELSWKMLKRQLEQELPSSTELDTVSYKALIRIGAERGLIADPSRWFDYRLMRNISSHTYNMEKARQVYKISRPFFESSKALLIALEGRRCDE